MKIATWNLERLKKRKKQLIIDKLIEIDADILILTETDSSIQLDNYFCVSTELLPLGFDNTNYKVGENRVSILTKYKTTSRHETYDSYTTVCSDIETPWGTLTVYGSIIGAFGNRQPRFDKDLYGQLADLERLSANGQICFAGDLNTTFSGRVWPSKKARQTLIDSFEKYKLSNTTASIQDTVDHIVLSASFIENRQPEIKTWNQDKKISDHVGHLLTLLNVGEKSKGA
jgi:exonuclease III